MEHVRLSLRLCIIHCSLSSATRELHMLSLVLPCCSLPGEHCRPRQESMKAERPDPTSLQPELIFPSPTPSVLLWNLGAQVRRRSVVEWVVEKPSTDLSC